MSKKLYRASNGFCLVILTATTPLYAAEPDGDRAGASSPVASPPAPSVEQLAAQGASAFKAQRFEEALGHYQQAEQATIRPDERAPLAMNQGACLVELGRLAEAKSVFLRVATQFPAVEKKARLNAALIAVELGQVDEAESLLAAARPLDDSLLSREQDLLGRIAENRSAARHTELQAYMVAAASAIKQSDWSAAEKALLAAEIRFEVAEPSERIDVLNGLATTQLALERPLEAKTTVDKALALSPEDPELHYAKGRVLEALELRAEARDSYRRALELGLKAPLNDNARASIDELDPLEPSEWSAWLAAFVGYDSNPRQSGAATETTMGSRGRGGSGYGRMLADVGRSQRVHEQVSLSLRYAGEWIGMQKPTVRELSLQNHGAYLGAQWAPTDRLVLGLETGPSVTYVGMSVVSPYTWDYSAILRARYRASTVRAWRAIVEVRGITGATDWEFLKGTRLDAELSHSWHYQTLDLRLGLRGRALSIGTRTTTVDVAAIPACAGVCDGAGYEIPLSYLGLGPIAGARLALHRQLQLTLFGQVDWRQYQAESYIVGVEASRKQRVDVRYNLGVDLRWALDQDEHFVIAPSYALLVSSSNVAQSRTDAEHFYDYDDRSFVQHLAELGLEVRL